MTELTDASGAFSYGDSILVGERVRLRGVRDDDLPTLAQWEMDPGRTATLKNRVVPPSEASAKEFIAKSSANQESDLGFAIETLDDPPLLVGFAGLWGNGVKLSGDWHQPEGDLGQGRQPGGLAWLAGLIPSAWALGLAFVAASGAGRDEVAVPGDLGGQVGGELIKLPRGKSIRSR